MTAIVHRLTDDEPQPAAIPATYEITIAGVRRDMLKVHEIAPRIFGTGDEKACDQVRDLIRSGRLFAVSTGRQYLIPVSAYVAYQRGERYPST